MGPFTKEKATTPITIRKMQMNFPGVLTALILSYPNIIIVVTVK
jgi:hypothetical protein